MRAGVSVVVPTYRRRRLLEDTLRSVLDQTALPDEILVVENEPGGPAADVVRSLGPTAVPLRHLVEPELGVSRARNRGTNEAAGPLVAFIDDDSVASPVWLEALTDAFHATPGAIAAGGRIVLRWPCRRPPWLAGLDGYYGALDLGPDRVDMVYPLFPYASNVIFDRAALLSIGGFPVQLGRRGSSLRSSEETGLFRRVADHGWRVVYEPRALIHHLVHADRVTRRWLLRRAFMQGRSDVLVEAMFSARRPGDRPRRAAAALSGVLDGKPPVNGSVALTPVHHLAGVAVHLGAVLEELRR